MFWFKNNTQETFLKKTKHAQNFYSIQKFRCKEVSAQDKFRATIIFSSKEDLAPEK